MDPAKHNDLINAFIPKGDSDRREQIGKILSDMASIMKVTRATYVPSPVAGQFKQRCVEWSDYLDLCFPTLPWPHYMHYLIAHGQEMLGALGSIGFWSEQASEHCNKVVKHASKWLSRPRMDDMLCDVMGRMWDRGDPWLRVFEMDLEDDESW